MRTRGRGRSGGARWPYLGTPQKALLLAGLGVWAGAALPWAIILGRVLWGAPLAVSWTLWAGLMVLAGASVRWPILAAASAAVGGGTAIWFGAWQGGRILSTCPLSTQCLPGPGIVVLVAAGAIAIVQARRILQRRRAT
jgi:hypothetical protein